jgi:segregation and condensation protein B
MSDENHQEELAAISQEENEFFEEFANDGVSSMAAEDRAETLSEEERLIVDEIELGEELEAEIGEETLLDEAASLASPESAGQDEDEITATREEIKPAIEALLFVAEEPLPFKILSKLLGDVSEEDVRAALDELVADYEARKSGLEIREIAGGWRISTRPQNHDFIRKYLKSRPSARLSLPALETLAVIAYKQPITIPEILEIRGVTSSSAIKTLLEKRLIVTKGRKETVGRPMLYGTSKEFLIQFGLKDLSELPSIEDFEDLAQ